MERMTVCNDVSCMDVYKAEEVDKLLASIKPLLKEIEEVLEDES